VLAQEQLWLSDDVGASWRRAGLSQSSAAIVALAALVDNGHYKLLVADREGGVQLMERDS